jgi:hypothetical protein
MQNAVSERYVLDLGGDSGGHVFSIIFLREFFRLSCCDWTVLLRRPHSPNGFLSRPYPLEDTDKSLLRFSSSLQELYTFWISRKKSQKVTLRGSHPTPHSHSQPAQVFQKVGRRYGEIRVLTFWWLVGFLRLTEDGPFWGFKIRLRWVVSLS